jgi:hypothetical protein
MLNFKNISGSFITLDTNKLYLEDRICLIYLTIVFLKFLTKWFPGRTTPIT